MLSVFIDLQENRGPSICADILVGHDFKELQRTTCRKTVITQVEFFSVLL